MVFCKLLARESARLHQGRLVTCMKGYISGRHRSNEPGQVMSWHAPSVRLTQMSCCLQTASQSPAKGWCPVSSMHSKHPTAHTSWAVPSMWPDWGARLAKMRQTSGLTKSVDADILIGPSAKHPAQGAGVPQLSCLGGGLWHCNACKAACDLAYHCTPGCHPDHAGCSAPLGHPCPTAP